MKIWTITKWDVFLRHSVVHTVTIYRILNEKAVNRVQDSVDHVTLAKLPHVLINVLIPYVSRISSVPRVG